MPCSPAQQSRRQVEELAATKIQASFRAYREHSRYEQSRRAATVIQRFVR
jgi:hypothetical protein